MQQIMAMKYSKDITPFANDEQLNKYKSSTFGLGSGLDEK